MYCLWRHRLATSRRSAAATATHGTPLYVAIYPQQSLRFCVSDTGSVDKYCSFTLYFPDIFLPSTEFLPAISRHPSIFFPSRSRHWEPEWTQAQAHIQVSIWKSRTACYHRVVRFFAHLSVITRHSYPFLPFPTITSPGQSSWWHLCIHTIAITGAVLCIFLAFVWEAVDRACPSVPQVIQTSCPDVHPPISHHPTFPFSLKSPSVHSTPRPCHCGNSLYPLHLSPPRGVAFTACTQPHPQYNQFPGSISVLVPCILIACPSPNLDGQLYTPHICAQLQLSPNHPCTPRHSTPRTSRQVTQTSPYRCAPANYLSGKTHFSSPYLVVPHP